MIRQALDATRLSHVVDQLDLGRWVAIATVGCAAIAVWALPPQVRPWFNGYRPEASTALELEQRAAVKAAVDLNAEQVREAWLQTMRGHLSETPLGDVAFWLPEDIEPELSHGFREAVSSAVQAFDRPETPVRVGYFVVDKNQGGHPDLTRMDRFASNETYLGEFDGERFCLTGKVRSDVEVSHDQLGSSAENPNRALRDLGTCGFYAKYGQPSVPMSAWLAEGGYRYADFVFVDRFPQVGFKSARGTFGVQFQGIGLEKQACAAGSVEVCEMLFLEPLKFNVLRGVWTRHPPVAAYSDVGQPWFDIALLGWLEKEFGEDAFADFWTSDLPVKEAFADAFQVPLDVWMRDLTVRMVGPVTPGPAPRTANVFGSLLFIALGIMFSLFISRRGNARLA